MSKRINLSLLKQGDLVGECTFIRYPYADITSNNKVAVFLCKCGKEFEARVQNVRHGTTKSCGCLRIATSIKNGTKHGNCYFPEYKSWYAMIKRCYYPKETAYERYGGRGIIVCDRWLGESGYDNFLLDIGKKPTPKHTIERIDNDGNYEPSNCRWATMAEQCSNRCSSSFLTFNGRTQTISMWAREININQGTLWSRIYKYFMSVEKALYRIKYSKQKKN